MPTRNIRPANEEERERQGGKMGGGGKKGGMEMPRILMSHSVASSDMTANFKTIEPETGSFVLKPAVSIV